MVLRLSKCSFSPVYVAEGWLLLRRENNPKPFCLASVTVYYANSSPCKPPVEHVCSCKNGQLSTNETCTVCACSHDGNFRRCETSRWMDIPSSWILEESSWYYCPWYCYFTPNKALKAFDGNPVTYWEPMYRVSGYKHWVILDFQTSHKIRILSITNHGGGGQDVVSFTVESSPVSPYLWEIAHSSGAVVPGTSDPQEFRLDFIGRYMRLTVDTQSGVRPIIREVGLFGTEDTGGAEGSTCPALNTGCVISDAAGESSPPGGQSCYVTADIHEGLRSRDSPLQVHRTATIVLHGDLAFECEEGYQVQLLWTVRGYNYTSGGGAMDELLPHDAPRDNIHLSIAPRALPLGVHMVQLQAIMKVNGSGHVSVSTVQTWIEFVRLPVVYSLGSSLRTVRAAGNIEVDAASLTYDPEELVPSSEITYRHVETTVTMPECGLFLFRHLPGTDCSGGVITSHLGVSLQFCASACCADPTCLSFQHNVNSDCIIKSRLCTDAEKIAASAGNMYDRLTDYLGTNVALGRPCTASRLHSSTYYAGKAVDGISFTILSSSFPYGFHALSDLTNPWWQVHLSRPYAISNIVIYNRVTYAPERINPFNLHLGNSTDVQANALYGGGLNFDDLSQMSKTIPIDGVTAQYVGLVLPGSGRTFILCEVEVYTEDEQSDVRLGSQVAGSDPGVLVFESPADDRPLGLIANITVEITAGNFPPVTRYTVLQVVPDDSLGQLDIQCEPVSRQENCDPSKTASTEALELFTESQIFGTTEFTLEEYPAAFAGQDWTAGIDTYLSDDTRLRVVAGTFWAEGYYTIRLTDHYVTDVADFSRIAEWRFNVYPTPEQLLGEVTEGDSSDACTMMPTGGVALIDRFCAKCIDFADILGPVEISMQFELIPVGAEMAKSAFPGDGPPTDNRIFIPVSSQWVPYTPLVDLAAGTLLLTVRATSPDGRYAEFGLPPIEINPPSRSQLQSYMDNYFVYPDGGFFKTLALGDAQTAFKGSIFASAVTGAMAAAGDDTTELVDKVMDGLGNVPIDNAGSVSGVTISIFLATGSPEMVSGKSQVSASSCMKKAFDKTRELADDLEKTPMEEINKMAAVMLSGSVNLLSASSIMAEKEQRDDTTYSTDLDNNKEATTASFQALDTMNDMYLNKMMPEYEDLNVYADFSLSKLHLRIQRENRTRFEKLVWFDENGTRFENLTMFPVELTERVYLVGGDSDCLVRVPSLQSLVGNSCPTSEDVGIQFVESNFNPFEYSNNSQEIRTDVTGLEVKCGDRTIPVSGLSEPIDILTRRKNESVNGSVYIFEASAALGNLTVFEFLVGMEQSTLGFDIDFNSTRFPQDVSLFLCKDCVPTQDAFNWTATLPVSEDQIVSVPWINGTNLTSSPYQWLLHGEEVDITEYDVGNLTKFGIGVQFGSELDSDEEERVHFTLTVFESSCVYFDEEVDLWHSDGCEVGLLTNMTHIHCRCDHLTKFAGFVPPNPLNIAQALSANVLENPSGMVLVLAVFALYLFGILFARKADRRDLQKAGVGILPGHTLNPRKECQYVITVYTGFRGNAGTTAEVTVVLGGLTNESIPFKLRDEKRVLFEKGSVDSFLLSTEEPLGDLSHLRVWHNNKGYSPGWFLSQIVVTNRARNNTTYFLCNRWLSVEEDDGKVHRILPRAVPEDLKKFRNLFLAKSARDMNDGHMWFSVVGRPARSPFTRVQRLSCCLTLLYSTMLTNIMFFGRGDDFEPPEPIRFAGVEINPPISLPQIMIGVQSAAIILPVNVLIAFLFRNSGPRGDKSTDKKGQEECAKSEDPLKAKSSLPWWTVYIGWVLVWSASFVAAFFTVLYTLSFGRAKAEAWLVTFLTSFVTDLFLMQPFKLLIVAVIFALISKTPVEDDEPAPEPLEPGEEFLPSATPESKMMSNTPIPLAMRWQTASGWKRYLWREKPESYGVQTIQDSVSGRLDSPPDEATLAEQRQKSAEKRKRRAAVLEVLVFGLFIAVVMATSYGERSPMAFYMTQNVGRQILETGDVGFFEIADIPSFWTWITTGLMPALHVRSWYNGRVSPDAMLLTDMVTYPLGPVQLRQVRLGPGQHCAPPDQMLNVTSRCSVPYTLSVADTQNYTLLWVTGNTTANGTGDTVCSSSSSQTSRELHNCANNVSPWRYTYASLTDGVPYFGQHGSYISGGYIAWLGTTDESMTFLKRQSWLDENSRAVFIELILYNSHVNLFSVVSLVVEFSNLGGVYKSSEIVTVRLIQHDVILLLVLRGVLALFLLYFVFREGKSLMSQPLEYLSEFLSWVELLVITIGFSTLVIYFYTQNIIDEVAEQRRNGNSVFHLYKSAVSWFQISTYLQGFLICCATLKFIRLLRFNSHVYALSMTMKKSLKPLMSFMLSVAVILFAFILVMSLTQGSNSNEYKNLSSSLQSLLLMMLGSFDFDALSSGHRILGPLVFFLYQVVMQFILLSIFMVILFDVYEHEAHSENPHDIGFTSYLKETASEAVQKSKDTSFKIEIKKPKMERRFSTNMIPKIYSGLRHLNSDSTI